MKKKHFFILLWIMFLTLIGVTTFTVIKYLPIIMKVLLVTADIAAIYYSHLILNDRLKKIND